MSINLELFNFHTFEGFVEQFEWLGFKKDKFMGVGFAQDSVECTFVKGSGEDAIFLTVKACGNGVMKLVCDNASKIHENIMQDECIEMFYEFLT